MSWSPLDFSAHGIFLARILEGLAFFFSKYIIVNLWMRIPGIFFFWWKKLATKQGHVKSWIGLRSSLRKEKRTDMGRGGTETWRTTIMLQNLGASECKVHSHCDLILFWQQLPGVGGTTPVYARRKGDFGKLSGWSVITTTVTGEKLKPRHLPRNLRCHSAVFSLSLAWRLLDRLHLQETITNLQSYTKNYIIVFND